MYPAYHKIKAEKQLCYPSDVNVTEIFAEVKLQSLINSLNPASVRIPLPQNLEGIFAHKNRMEPQRSLQKFQEVDTMVVLSIVNKERNYIFLKEFTQAPETS
ncbi:hypothetical protein AVEN_128536-1 [Araneus ventricosus]|uniref:Uncharacterized protein n=1 Tax=Araneus ventricosus TaxID=182803 RepID=A0A4Y2UF02_ARAVE|nr:hypothetical protein AVEN_230069-1 [Araneus ventricosus]GBO10580.1 hypothetical protein AVEN_23103-1 [Araneus ventricosus]GBO10581.1 hypothetical protein AVEN_76064-1 [Araneus ventricosus]GBO10582.1 hypothetical protein AVEN_128536-1 [Araneus ventricosus]